ncbi:type IV pilus modification PilV family protein [Levilactobacillus enshiensis]|uniref:type IV pilus modification PilV family protein n=1 Tax=Levilactobacillus enshiensis TaxID=2590213 RepID=UPI00117BA409|nr:hypothetical protein [Levilactobacillus enshiensis]
MLRMNQFGDHAGWTLPDALIALSIVAVTIIMVQQVLITNQRQTAYRTQTLLVARRQHDQALANWVAQQ